jgi:hypothetical protein
MALDGSTEADRRGRRHAAQLQRDAADQLDALFARGT